MCGAGGDVAYLFVLVWVNLFGYERMLMLLPGNTPGETRMYVLPDIHIGDVSQRLYAQSMGYRHRSTLWETVVDPVSREEIQSETDKAINIIT